MSKLTQFQKDVLSKMIEEFENDMISLLEDLREVNEEMYLLETDAEKGIIASLKKLDFFVINSRFENEFANFSKISDLIDGLSFKELRKYELKRVLSRSLSSSFGVLSEKFAVGEEECKAMFKTLNKMLFEYREINK